MTVLLTLDQAAKVSGVWPRELEAAFRARTLNFKTRGNATYVADNDLREWMRRASLALPAPITAGTSASAIEVDPDTALTVLRNVATVRASFPILAQPTGHRHPFTIAAPGGDWTGRAIAALHEAAHAVVAKQLGYTRVFAALDPSEDFGGLTRTVAPAGRQASQRRYADLLMIASGSLAVTLRDRGFPATGAQRQTLADNILADSASDSLLIEQLARKDADACRATVQPDAYVRAYVAEAIGDAADVLARNWPDVVDLTTTLHKDGKGAPCTPAPPAHNTRPGRPDTGPARAPAR